MPLLSVQNLNITKAKPDRWLRYLTAPEKLLDQVSFDIEENQCLGLVGEQHSGKMPLTMALLRLHPVTSGSIDYRGQNILTMSKSHFRKCRREIQVVFYDDFSALNPHHTVAKLLSEPLIVHLPHLTAPEKKHRLNYTMELVGIPEKMNTAWPDELNADQRIRVALARALITEPRLLICHDITNGLDTPVQAAILNLLLDIKSTLNLTLFIVTHDLAIADHMSDHVLILHRGSIVESGSSEEIVHQPKHSYTRKLVASTTTM